MDFPGHFEQIFQQLNHQRVHGQLCDCVIVVGGRHFKAHRAVLAACSTHFRALFSVSEGDGNGNVSVIQLDSEVVTGEAFSALVDMMYTSTLSLGESNVMDVLLAASHLHLNAVVKACKHYLNTRTLPKSPLGERAGARPNPRLQRSFLLQQLGLSLVSSALHDENMEEEAGSSGQGAASVSRSGLTDQRDAFYPPRRLQKRKQGYSLLRSEPDRSWQRSRPASQAAADGEGGAAGEELLSPDSRSKMVDEDSKPDVVVIAGDDRDDYRRASAQEDVQMPSQSDGGGVEPLLVPRKEEQAKGGEGAVESQHVQVVVKSEPISSPDPADETSDITSQAEGSDQVETGGEKLELSPDGSDHSFGDPQPSSELLLSDIKGSVDVGERGERAAVFLSTSGYEHGSGPNPGAGECAPEREPPRFLFGSDPSSSLLLPPSQSLFPGEVQDFPGLRADAVLLRPLHDGIPSSTEHLAAEYQRSGLRALGFPPYRRIAPKIPPGDGQAQDGSRTHASPGSAAAAAAAANPLPQLTRASADVLSKCKKALSEHNVLVVEGARKYACKICCKTFLTLTDCKKHIRVHTGEKPYACLKCGKRFSQSSHLYKHSKTTCLRWQSSNVPNALL